MNPIILVNLYGDRALAFAWPMLWQSSLLVLVLFALDLGLRRKVRAGVRYVLWLVVLIKLLLPPSLAFPSGLAWWLRPAAPAATVHSDSTLKVVYGPAQAGSLPKPIRPAPANVTPPAVSLAGWALVGWGCLSLTLLGWTLIRCRQIAGEIRQASPAPEWLQTLLEETQRTIGLPWSVRLKLLERNGCPTVSGLFRPTVLMPRPLLAQLTTDQMRAVLLHELIHVRRGDAWINCFQVLLQISYGWHPLLWLANARIRHVREEAVDDAVMLALGSRSCTYAPTLLEVAKTALQPPLASVGPIGILESRSFLRQRVERLIDFRPPAKGLALISTISVVTFAAAALPMGEAPPSASRSPLGIDPASAPWPDARFDGYAEINLEPQFLIASEMGLRSVLPSLIETREPMLVVSNEVAELHALLQRGQAQPYTAAEPLSFRKFSGGTFHWLIGGVTNNLVNYLTRNAGGKTIVTGADVTVLATQPGWIPLELAVTPWSADSGVRCQMRFGVAFDTNPAQTADATIPKGDALVWAIPTESGQYEVVLLQEKSTDAREATAHSAEPGAASEDGLGVPTNHVPDLTLTATGSPQRPAVGEALAAEGEPFAVAPSSTGNPATGIFRATNGASLKYGPMFLSADRLTGVISNQQLMSVIAEGNVRLQKDQEVVQADHLRISRLDYSTNAGVSREPGSALAELSGTQPESGLGKFGYDLSYRPDVKGEAAVTPDQLSEKPAAQAPPQINIKTKFVTLPEDANVSLRSLFGGTNLAGNGDSNYVSVLSPAQSAVLVKALQSNPSAEFQEASVTTLSGRETEVQVIDLKNVVTNLNPRALNPPGIFSTNGLYQSGSVPLGPTLDSVASVLDDGRNLRFEARVSVTEFVGYDDPKGKVAAYIDGKRTYVVRPLPHFRDATITTTVVVPDGHTLLLATSMNDESPSPRPIPGLKKNQLLVLVTPVLIDPAGNRVHPEE